MKALRTSGERQVDVLDLPIPKPEPGEVVIQMRATGICGSDLHPYRRPTPLHLNPGFISGHEPCGVITEVGAGVTGWQVGDRVAPYFRRTCGQCANCRAAKRNVCSNRRASYGHQGQDGSHCEYMRVEEPCLIRLPDHLSFLDGAILACQGGTAYAPLVRMGVSGRDVLVVSGLGPVGLLSVLFAKPMGATVVGIDPSAGRRAIALKLGADVVLDPADGPVGEQLRAHFPDGADKLTETSGANSAHRVMGDLLHAHGMVALVGGGTPEFSVSLGGISGKELTIIGSSAYAPQQFAEISTFVQRQNVNLESVVSHQFPLEDGPEAYRIAADANSGKVCFRFD
ncbi:MAG: zinc-binding dehydrogenase [Chloroflexota bacterium]